jgi:dolichol-phosphate mannosyltransferase
MTSSEYKNSNAVKLSVVSPVYMAEHTLDELVKSISESLNLITQSFEIILVEDSSPDRSWEKICELCNTDKRIKGIKFSRNYGQHNAIAAGLQYCKGEHVVVMDCDLQDNPDYIVNLYNKANEGFDIVYTKIQKRNHSFIKNLLATLYYKFLSSINSFKLPPDPKSICNYSIISRKVVDSYLEFNDYHKAYLLVLQWLGFSHSYIQVVQNQRFKGKSSYSLKKLFIHAFRYTVSYSERLLYLSIIAGLFFSFTSFLGGGIIIYQFLTTNTLDGWSSIMVTITFFGGLILLSLGVLGVYLSKVYEQTKNRPRFIISQAKNIST